MKAEAPPERDEMSGQNPAVVLAAPAASGAFTGPAIPRSSPAVPSAVTSRIASGAGYLRSRLQRAALALLLVCASLAVLAIVGTAVNWCRVDVVLSGSMAPTLRPGDVILAVSEPDSKVAVGQVLAFHPPYDPSIVVVHRVIQVAHQGKQVEIRTQGDDNNAPDAWTAVLEGTSAWRVSWVLPSAGYVAIWATYPWVHLLALLVVIGIVVWEVLRRVWRAEPR
ncbi:MAG: signal peptidase I [Candidatus Dormibacteria bacterium]|jgi:signal peptidase